MKYVPLIFKNLMRNARRTVLTMLALAISFFLYCAIFTLIDGMFQRIHSQNADLNLILRPKYVSTFFDGQLPPSYLQKIKELPLTFSATPYKIYIGYGRSDERTAFVLGVDPREISKIRKLVFTDHRSYPIFQSTLQGALVGEIALAENKWRVGDHVILRGLRGNPSLPFTIIGTLKNSGDYGSAVVLHYDYLKNIFNGNGDMSIIFFRAFKPFQVPWLIEAAQKEFASSPIPVEIITEKAFFKSLLSEIEGVMSAIQVVAWVSIAATILIVGNTLSMTIRERKAEIGVMRTLGFPQWLLTLLFLGEAMILSGLGGILGAGLAWMVFQFGDIQIPAGMGNAKMSIGPQPEPLFEAILLAFAVGFVSSVVPAFRYTGKPITENLSSVD